MAWSKGVSGNPAGRPHGARTKSRLMLEQLVEGQASAVVQAAVAAALAGDAAAMKLILDRAFPVRKGTALAIPLPPIKSAADLVEASAIVTREMAIGSLTADEAALIGSVLRDHGRAIELVDMEARLAALEARSDGNS